MRSADRYAIAISISMILASFTLGPLTQDRSYLGVSWLLILVINAVGAVSRRTRAGSAGALLGQLAAIVLFAVWSSSVMIGGASIGFVDRVAALFSSASEHMQTESAPMTPDAGVKFLFLMSLGAVTVITDLLVVTLRKPALGLAPPLTVFLVPAIGLGTDTGPWAFIWIALGYVGILITDGLNRSAGWTRGLSRDTAGGIVPGGVVWRAGTYVAVPAIVLALIAASALPTLSLGGWGFGEGNSGSGGPLRLSDPTLDLKRNLTLPANRVVLTYRTNRPGGVYLRMASLPAFSNAGWQNSQLSIEQGNRLPQPPGLTEPSKDRRTTIQVADFSSEYLPLPFAPRSFDANGRWGYDPNSLVVISSDRNSDREQATRNLSYTVVSRDIDPDASVLNDVISGDPPDASLTTVVPDNLPNNIVRLTERITRDAGSPAAKAAAIQSYLRDPANFTYSTEPRPGSGYQALENFLFHDHQGYCEQFAATMALMARIVGIPSRVAVGFLPGTRNGAVWTVTARDSHAWPELYFSGYGWVRYEPTPSAVTGSAPSWTLPQAENAGDTQTDLPNIPQPTLRPSAGTNPQDPTDATHAHNATAEPTFNWGRFLGLTGAGLLLVVLLSTPAAIRIARRRARLGGAGSAGGDPGDRIEAGWAEVRDTIRDLRRSWPAGSPRSIAASVGRFTNAPTREALQRLSVLVERERYARAFTDTAAATEAIMLVRQIRHGLAADRSWRSRVGTTVLPRSVFRRRP
jgi:transglutaminase-like putative cysteine protease